MSFLKKACSIILVAAVVIAMFACIAYSGVSAAGGPQITLGSVKVAAGDTAEVKVSLASNGTSIYGVSFDVAYSDVTYTETTASLPEGTSYRANAESGTLSVVIYGSNVLSNGDLLTFKFTAPTDVLGSKTTELTVSNLKFSTLVEDVPTTISGEAVNGSIKSILYGDVNKDGELDSTDCLYIQRYRLAQQGQGYEEYSEIDADVADVYLDGTIDSTDCLTIQRARLARQDQGYEQYKVLPFIPE